MKNMRQAIWLFSILIFLGLVLSGCASVSQYLDFMGRHETLESSFQKSPSLVVMRELSPEDCFVLGGKFIKDGPSKGPLLVIALSNRFQHREIVASRIIGSPAFFYGIFLPEGDYELYVFSDENNNGYFDTNEMIGRTTPGKPVSIKGTLALDGITVVGPDIPLDFDHPLAADFPVHTKMVTNTYKHDSLDDEFFDSSYGTMGLYRPTEFLTHTQGWLFSLEEFDPTKTFILFVHGVEGTPQDWKYMVEGLDRKRFQPWFYYYPSGLRLEKLGYLLAHSIVVMNSMEKYQIERMVVVAHSMGGLVARAAIDNLCKKGRPPYLKMYISMSSPYGGVEDANKGLRSAPVVIPSWYDVATESPFLKHIYQQDLPPDVPFHMFFGYRNQSGISSDGVITVRSQLDSRVHLKAVKTYGFDTTHVGILNDEAVKRELYRLLDSVRP
ncbi:MAG: alpha/beta hydrolase [Syntrophaceae bacterium]